jgi:hypothetical protein
MKKQYIQNKRFKEDTKQFYRYLGAKTIRDQRPQAYGKV